MLVDYIDAHKADYGVEPICRALVQAGAEDRPVDVLCRESPGRRRPGRSETPN
ncbi:hypothetical protein [Rhodococcus sp. WB9]|uniref:hypothetical protein n=1 Tax=Rhodococcus sp. WB9 TaxID=2594007 RepID=UPI001642B275|nr:hypothetical protein [Rhodococcus sp. WB9]